ncbi:uncharacterized protein LOC111252252 isoform X1 [Varroa destructor]|uniref:Uncharacterized protein n=2 Tax=Varroa destructor TaxID=109461 RepID=A0A7M7KHG4_VARDE|nr:uncharacterized protein LOC111252252 isoform X1 [Varroa destructor]
MQTQAKMGAIRVTPLDEVLKTKSLKKKSESSSKALALGQEIRLSPGGVQLRLAASQNGNVPPGFSVPSTLSNSKLKALAYRPVPRRSREQETKDAFMLALGLRPLHAPLPAPITKAQVANVLGGTKAIKSFLRSPVTPLPRVACMASYLRHKGALVQFTPPSSQAKPKTAKSGKAKKTQPKYVGKTKPACTK